MGGTYFADANNVKIKYNESRITGGILFWNGLKRRPDESAAAACYSIGPNSTQIIYEMEDPTGNSPGNKSIQISINGMVVKKITKIEFCLMCDVIDKPILLKQQYLTNGAKIEYTEYSLRT